MWAHPKKKKVTIPNKKLAIVWETIIGQWRLLSSKLYAIIYITFNVNSEVRKLRDASTWNAGLEPNYPNVANDKKIRVKEEKQVKAIKNNTKECITRTWDSKCHKGS